MGFYTDFKNPEARREIVRYYSFLREHETLYRGNRPYAEVLLLFPRTRVHDGDVAAVDRFKQIGKRLLNEHVLFDVLPDDRATPTTRRPYTAIIDPSNSRLNATNVTTKLPSNLSQFKAPETVRVSASRPASGSELTLHLVNYNRTEPADKKERGKGIADEKPIATTAFEAALKVPRGFRASQIEFFTPENEQAQKLEFRQNGDRVSFQVPMLLVYGVVRITPKSGITN